MDRNQLIKQIKARCAESDTAAEFAARMKVSAGYLSDVLNSNRLPGRKFLKALGYERCVSYRRLSDKR